MVELTTSAGAKITADKVIFTAGGGLHNIEGSNVKTVLSPLLVVSPPVCGRNIVYLTPKTELTINHLHHVDPVSGKAYSIIGNGDGVNPSDEAGIEKSRANIMERAGQVFPALHAIPEDDKQVYFGHKTEFITQGKDRNYHYAFIPIEDSEKIWAAVPGKFTLAPSLATHIYEKFEGGPAPVKTFTPEEVNEYKELLTSHQLAIAETLHSQIVGKRVGRDEYHPESRMRRSKISETSGVFFGSPEERKTEKKETPGPVSKKTNVK